MPLVLLLAPAWALTPGVDLTDDPMVLTPRSTWSDTFADQVFDAGDVDGDGYDDVLVCDGPANSSNYALRREVTLFFGGPSGVSNSDHQVLDTNSGGANSAFACSPIGDADGDGLADLLIGEQTTGSVTIFHGDGSTDYASSIDRYTEGYVRWVPGGDLDGDGLQDVLLQESEGYPDSYTNRVTLRTGADGWARSTFDFSSPFEDAHSDRLVGAGDMDADGYDDVFYMDEPDYPYEGKVERMFVLTGGATTMAVGTYWDASTNYGSARPAGGGDFNGDGNADIAYAEQTGNSISDGEVYIVTGSGDSSIVDRSFTIRGRTYMNRSSGYFGTSLAFAGDVNRDGFDDLLIGAPYDWDSAGTSYGRAFLAYGGSSGPIAIEDVWSGEDAKRIIPQPVDGSAMDFAFGLAGLGDVNGDGVNDIAITWSHSPNSEWGDYPWYDVPGQARVWLGSCVDADGDAVCELDDCDESDTSIPSDTDAWYDGVDSDCDGWSDYDADRDGFDSDGHGGDDCDDADAEIRPDADEVWYDGVDFDCDGANDYDADGDGHEKAGYDGNDCDDNDPTISPDATEIWYDEVDQDCDGGSDFDADQDGFDSEDHGGEDCDDADASINPDAADIADDGVDSNCDGEDAWAGGEGDDTGESDADDDDDDDDDDDKGGCSSAPVAPGLSLVALAVLAVGRRRR